MPRIHRLKGFATIAEMNQFIERLELNGYGEMISVMPMVFEDDASFLLAYYVNTSFLPDIEALNNKIKGKEAN